MRGTNQSSVDGNTEQISGQAVSKPRARMESWGARVYTPRDSTVHTEVLSPHPCPVVLCTVYTGFLITAPGSLLRNNRLVSLLLHQSAICHRNPPSPTRRRPPLPLLSSALRLRSSNHSNQAALARGEGRC